jgi:hypothetical protein
MLVYKFLDAEFGLKSLHKKRLKVSRIDDLPPGLSGLRAIHLNNDPPDP